MITPINGRKGRAELNSIELNIDDCNVSFMTDEVPCTGFEDQQTDGRTPKGRTDGIDDFSGTLSGYINATAYQVPAGIAGAGNTIMGLPATSGLTQGAIFTTVKLFLDKSVATRYCGCTRCIVTRVNYMVKVTDAWKFSVEVKCAGGIIVHPSA